MSAYHQMGHDSTNLLKIQALDKFKGAIISPVNLTHEEAFDLVNKWKGRQDFEFIFDPQLYNPSSNKGKLKSWFYFPQSDNSMVLDTIQAWDNITSGLTDQVVNSIGVDGICTPITKPKVFRDDYYSLAIQVGNNFAKACQGANANCKVYQTLIVDLDDLTQDKRAKEIASIVAGTRTQAIYLVLNTNVIPRRELYDVKRSLRDNAAYQATRKQWLACTRKLLFFRFTPLESSRGHSFCYRKILQSPTL